MGKRIKKLKKIRLHREGTDTLIYGLMFIVAIGIILWRSFETHIPFYCFAVVAVTIYCIVVNFFRCPIRYFEQDDTENVVVAPADGRIVVVQEVEEKKYFHEPRIMVSIFMDLWNVHANWFPVAFHKAWLPKASEENEMADTIITTDNGVEILCRQIAGAVARRIVTYAKEGEECYIDEHLGFIKFGSRVDLFLPIGTEINVKLGQATTGNQTVIGRLKQ